MSEFPALHNGAQNFAGLSSYSMHILTFSMMLKWFNIPQETNAFYTHVITILIRLFQYDDLKIRRGKSLAGREMVLFSLSLSLMVWDGGGARWRLAGPGWSRAVGTPAQLAHSAVHTRTRYFTNPRSNWSFLQTSKFGK